MNMIHISAILFGFAAFGPSRGGGQSTEYILGSRKVLATLDDSQIPVPRQISVVRVKRDDSGPSKYLCMKTAAACVATYIALNALLVWQNDSEFFRRMNRYVSLPADWINIKLHGLLSETELVSSDGKISEDAPPSLRSALLRYHDGNVVDWTIQGWDEDQGSDKDNGGIDAKKDAKRRKASKTQAIDEKKKEELAEMAKESLHYSRSLEAVESYTRRMFTFLPSLQDCQGITSNTFDMVAQKQNYYMSQFTNFLVLNGLLPSNQPIPENETMKSDESQSLPENINKMVKQAIQLNTEIKEKFKYLSSKYSIFFGADKDTGIYFEKHGIPMGHAAFAEATEFIELKATIDLRDSCYEMIGESELTEEEYKELQGRNLIRAHYSPPQLPVVLTSSQRADDANYRKNMKYYRGKLRVAKAEWQNMSEDNEELLEKEDDIFRYYVNYLDTEMRNRQLRGFSLLQIIRNLPKSQIYSFISSAEEFLLENEIMQTADPVLNDIRKLQSVFQQHIHANSDQLLGKLGILIVIAEFRRAYWHEHFRSAHECERLFKFLGTYQEHLNLPMAQTYEDMRDRFASIERAGQHLAMLESKINDWKDLFFSASVEDDR